MHTHDLAPLLPPVQVLVKILSVAPRIRAVEAGDERFIVRFGLYGKTDVLGDGAMMLLLAIDDAVLVRENLLAFRLPQHLWLERRVEQVVDRQPIPIKGEVQVEVCL